jgi:hypothetical protein
MQYLRLIEGKTYQEISDILKERNPGINGLSIMSVRRFYTTNGIQKKITSDEIDVEKEGPESATQVFYFFQHFKTLFYLIYNRLFFKYLFSFYAFHINPLSGKKLL